MKEYTVLMQHQVVIEVSVVVEANSEEEAIEITKNLEENGQLNYSMPESQSKYIEDIYLEYSFDNKYDVIDVADNEE